AHNLKVAGSNPAPATMKTPPTPLSSRMAVFVFGRVLLLAKPMGCGKRCKAALKNAVILVY
ncbi:MAG: hypothetical protein VW495_09700, partial [Rhodobiaceae bacterium]